MDTYMVGNLLLIIGIVITIVAQIYVSKSYGKYKKVQNKKKLSGFEVAQKILEKNGLGNVYVTEVKGNLTDHYDAKRKVVRLSTDIFHGTTLAAASVAAHEVGHAIQDKEKYGFMRMRSSIFPLVNFSSYAGYFAILIGVIFNMVDLIWVGIALEMIILLFQLITLPVEFNASERAKTELKKCDILTPGEIQGSSSMLRAAAFTYVAAVLTTMLQILRLIVLTRGRDD